MQITKPTLKKPNPAKNSGLNYDELWEFYPEFFDKCSLVCSGGAWKASAIKYVKDLLEYLEDWDCISWRQFASVMTMEPVKPKNVRWGTKFAYLSSDEFIFDRAGVIVTAPTTIEKIPTTDYQIDKLHNLLFGEPPSFYEEYERGMTRSYDKHGNRIFLY